jgi:hypothetical protein
MRVLTKPNILDISSDESPRYRLTPNAEYFVLSISNDYLRVIDDDGEPILYPKNIFQVCEDTLPPDWQFDEGVEGDYYLDPKQTAAPGFYENYFGSDGDIEAQANAHRVLREVLEETLKWGQEADRLTIQRDLQRLVARQNNRI